MSSVKPFVQVALPHRDILEGRLSMDVFAADLWQVFRGNAPVEYQDPDIFFQKTFVTSGLKNLIEVAKRRLSGYGGESVIQLQTPFGGGKTHGLIALYHRMKEFGANIVVIDGTALDAKDVKLWEEMERQLTGSVSLLRGDTSPGRDKIIDLLSKKQPVLILMDEVLEYTVKAEGIKVGDSNLAVQTLAFLQELTGAVGTIEKALLVATLPSSTLEHYSEESERLFQQIQKIFGRVESIFTPVQEEEIEGVVRRRLFQSIDEKSVKMIVDEFVSYLAKENLLTGDDLNIYRDRFTRSYPFKPEVIDILYKRWGSFASFQRTRGVLRLLSMLVYDLREKDIPFISLGDFNLANEEIKRELIKHIGQEYDSIIAQDITSSDAGAKKVDKEMGTSYLPYHLGTRVATSIFMMSFSGRGEKGSSIRDIKISACLLDFPSSVVDDVLNKLKERLFYLSDEGLYFSNQPNLNRILISREENISEGELFEEEKDLVRKFLPGKDSKFSIYVFPRSPIDVRDNRDLKLVILKDFKVIQDFIEHCGEKPRVYRNTLVFLYPDESNAVIFYRFLRQKKAWELIESDDKLALTEGQKKEVRRRLEDAEKREYEVLRQYYRKLYVPGKGERDLGTPTYSTSPRLDEEIYSFLRNEGFITEKITYKYIVDKYLKNGTEVETRKILESIYNTPGEIMITSEDVVRDAIKEGREKGIIDILVKDESEVITVKKPGPQPLSGTRETTEGIPQEPSKVKDVSPVSEGYKKVYLKLDVPVGRLSDISKLVNNILRSRFNNVKLKIEIDAEDGFISKSDYEDKVSESFFQTGIEVIEEEKG